jgi:hypothetical protein
LIRPHVVLRNDARPPILYLRSFSEDIEGYSYKLIQKTPEEQLVSEYNYWGPVIAVGQPGERHPFLGALRIYFDDEVWRAGVLYLMSVSQLVNHRCWHLSKYTLGTWHGKEESCP